jgi:hypothetical protein
MQAATTAGDKQEEVVEDVAVGSRAESITMLLPPLFRHHYLSSRGRLVSTREGEDAA